MAVRITSGVAFGFFAGWSGYDVCCLYYRVEVRADAKPGMAIRSRPWKGGNGGVPNRMLAWPGCTGTCVSTERN